MVYISKGHSNNGKVFCLRTKVSRLGLEPILCWTETPQLESGVIIHTIMNITLSCAANCMHRLSKCRYQRCDRLLKKKPDLRVHSVKACEREPSLHTFIFSFKRPTLQSEEFHMVLSSCSYEFDLLFKKKKNLVKKGEITFLRYILRDNQ